VAQGDASDVDPQTRQQAIDKVADFPVSVPRGAVSRRYPAPRT
jgi:hypothetical protein